MPLPLGEGAVKVSAAAHARPLGKTPCAQSSPVARIPRDASPFGRGSCEGVGGSPRSHSREDPLCPIESGGQHTQRSLVCLCVPLGEGAVKVSAAAHARTLGKTPCAQ